MKKKNILIGFITATILLWSVNTAAQTTVANFTEFDAAFRGMINSGGSIKLTGDVNFTADYEMVADALITIDADIYRFIVNANNVTLTIGNNVSITGVGSTDNSRIINAIGAGRNIVVNSGATITGTGTATRILNGSAGSITITGGTIENKGTGSCRAIDVQGAGTITITGGTIINNAGNNTSSAINTTTAKINISGGNLFANGASSNIINTTNSATINITGGTFTVGGAQGHCIRTDTGNLNKIDINGTNGAGVVIKLNGNDVRCAVTLFNNANSNTEIKISGKVIIANDAIAADVLADEYDGTSKATATGFLLNGTAKVVIAVGAEFYNLTSIVANGGNTSSYIFDYNKTLGISADPATGTSFPDANGVVTLKIENPNGNDYAGYTGICYTTDGSDPEPGNVENLFAISSVEIPIQEATVVIKARVGRAGTIWTDSAIETFTYTSSGDGGPVALTRNVATFEQFKQAIIDSQGEDVISTTINIAAPITITDVDYEINPANTHPILINMNSSITTGANTVLGGNLTIKIGVAGEYLTIGGNTIFNEGLTINSEITQGIRTTGDAILTINNGTFDCTGTNSITLFYLNSATTVVNVKGGTFKSVGTNGTIFHFNSNGAKATIDGGEFFSDRAFLGAINLEFNAGVITQLTGNARAFHMNAGTPNVIFNGGSVKRSDDANYNPQIFRVEGGSPAAPCYVEINGGTFDPGTSATIFQFTAGGDANCIVRNMVNDGTAEGIYTLANEPEAGAHQKIYDFRAHEVVIPQNKLHSRSDSPGKLFVSELLVETANGIDPVDAALSNDPKNYEIWYRVGSNPIVGEGFSLYEGEEIEVNEGQPLHVYTKMGEYTSAEMTVDLLSTPITNISIPSINRAAYIADNTLYLPESGAVQVFNVGGQLLLNVLATDATLDVSSLSKGIYIVKVGAATFKVVK